MLELAGCGAMKSDPLVSKGCCMQRPQDGNGFGNWKQ